MKILVCIKQVGDGLLACGCGRKDIIRPDSNRDYVRGYDGSKLKIDNNHYNSRPFPLNAR